MTVLPIVMMVVSLTAIEKPLTEPVPVKLVAIQAQDTTEAPEERRFDPKLDSVKSLLESRESLRKYDEFTQLKSESFTLDPNKPTRIRLNERYGIVVSAVSQDNEGRIRLNVSVKETTRVDGKPLDRRALHTTSVIEPGKQLLLGGLQLDEGDLLIMVSISDQS